MADVHSRRASRDIPTLRLHLDITAVLLGTAHLNILDEVEDTFKPLRIPASLVSVLVQVRERIAHHQPARIHALQQVVELAEREVLKLTETVLPRGYQNDGLANELGEEFAVLFEHVQHSGGYRMLFSLCKRTLDGPPSSFPEGADQILINCRSVVEALRKSMDLWLAWSIWLQSTNSAKKRAR